MRPDLVTGPTNFRGLFPPRSNTRMIAGLMAAGVRVKDVGLALSPMAYYGQFALDWPLRGDGYRLA